MAPRNRKQRARQRQLRQGGPKVQRRSAPPPPAKRQRRAWMLVAVLAVLTALAAVGFGLTRALGSHSTSPRYASAHPRRTSVASLLPTSTAATAASGTHGAVDGIQCGSMEQLNYHIHQYLELYDHGQPLSVPAEIGIPGGEDNADCFYWIHVHADSANIIHVESPVQQTFHLGNFFDIWEATKSSAVPSGDAFIRKLQASDGQITVFVNGKRWSGSYRAVPLTEHEVIAVEMGKPVVPPQPYNDWSGL